MTLLLIALAVVTAADDPPPVDSYAITEIAYARDGSFLVTGGAQLENGLKRVGPLRIWDGKSGRLLRRLKSHTDEVTAIAISPNGRRLATSSNDFAVWLWDLRTYPCEHAEAVNRAKSCKFFV